MTEPREGKCLGLIGGLGVGATIHYYQELVKAHAALGCVPNLLIAHADVNRVMGYAATREIGPMAEYLSGLIRRLYAGGAEVAVLPAITPHLCASELAARSPIPLVNLVEEIALEVDRRGLKRVALFGTRFAVESSLFGRLPGVDVILPHPNEIDLIHSTYVQLLNTGAGTDEAYNNLRRVAFTLCERDGVEAIILAGTDLSLVFNEVNTDFPHIDSTRLHLAAIMRALFP